MKRILNKQKNVIFATKNIITQIKEFVIIVMLLETDRGSTHESCNLNSKFTDKIPVIFHNLRGYDSHFIMRQIGEIAKNHKYMNKNGEEKEILINAIPNNMEKYMAFMLGNNLVFIDSFQFMSSSLDKLVSNLPKESLKYTSEIFKEKHLILCQRKVFILMIIWIHLKRLMKQNYLQKNNFI